MPAIGAFELGPRPCVVAAGGEAEIEGLVAADGADVVELRADLFVDPTVDAIHTALARLRRAGRPVILTVRSASEGGRAMAEERRAEIYAEGVAVADAVDVELASTALAASVVARARQSGRTVILSAHDFAATADRAALAALLERAFAAGADVAKLATHAATLEDLRRLIDVTLAARTRPVATLAMGPWGPLSRLVLPSCGSVLTYGSVGAPTAPGQMPVRELAALVARLFPA